MQVVNIICVNPTELPLETQRITLIGLHLAKLWLFIDNILVYILLAHSGSHHLPFEDGFSCNQ